MGFFHYVTSGNSILNVSAIFDIRANSISKDERFGIPLLLPCKLSEFLSDDTEVIISVVENAEDVKKLCLRLGFTEEKITILYSRPPVFNFDEGLALNVLQRVIGQLPDDCKCMCAYGTLLGLWREGALIKHDYDLDMWVVESTLKLADIEKIKNFIELSVSGVVYSDIQVYKIPKNNFISSDNPAMYQLIFYFDNSTMVQIDFFYLLPSGNDFYSTHGAGDLYKLSEQLFIEIVTLELNGEFYPIPKETEKILEVIYGNWRVPEHPNEDGRYVTHLHRVL